MTLHQPPSGNARCLPAPFSTTMPQYSAQQIEDALDTWTQAILTSGDERPLAIVGLISHGDALAQRLVRRLEAAGRAARYGALDITLYRDDLCHLRHKPALRSSHLPFSTDGMRLILVDDVLHTGRTVRAALNAIFDYGRPARVELHCLVDRGGRELPIEPNYAAIRLVAPVSCVQVKLAEVDGADEIIINETT